MWKTVKPYFLVASLALNAAFITMWIAHAAPSQVPSEQPDGPAARSEVWCPLHRELGVRQEQWTQIEPRLRAFQANVGDLRERVVPIRSEVIEMLAAEQPDIAAIRAKQDEILATKRAIQGLVVDHLLAEKEILTRDQQSRLFEMLQEHVGRCGTGPPMSGKVTGRGMGQLLRERPDQSKTRGD